MRKKALSNGQQQQQHALFCNDIILGSKETPSIPNGVLEQPVKFIEALKNARHLSESKCPPVG